jgi:hypothetical protein
VVAAAIGGAALGGVGAVQLGLRAMAGTLQLGHLPSAAACSALLEACAAAADGEEAALDRSLELLGRLYETGLGPDCGTLAARLVTACGEASAACGDGGGLGHGLAALRLLASRGCALAQPGGCPDGCSSLLAAARRAVARGRHAVVTGVRALDAQALCGLTPAGPASPRAFLAAAAGGTAAHLAAARAIESLLGVQAPPSPPPVWPPPLTPPAPSTADGLSARRVENRAAAAAAAAAAATGGKEKGGAGKGEDSEGDSGAGAGSRGSTPHTPPDSIVRAAEAADRRPPDTPTPGLSANKMLSRIAATPTRRQLSFGDGAAQSDDDDDDRFARRRAAAAGAAATFPLFVDAPPGEGRA